MRHYQNGYYTALATGVDGTSEEPLPRAEQERIFPAQPVADYNAIAKDIKRTFSEEPFFQLVENQDKIRRILTAFVRRNPLVGYI